MHNGRPCEDLYPNEYFEDGITNGAKWYNVPGRPTSFILFCNSLELAFIFGILEDVVFRKQASSSCI